MDLAEIAQKLVAHDSGLLSEHRKSELMMGIDKEYNTQYAVVVKLTEDDLALSRLAATHEDDLPAT
jgi:hypothetical protein